MKKKNTNHKDTQKRDFFKNPDRTTAYALDVISGRIKAGPYVRGACQRHLNDLNNADTRGFYYDSEAAEEAIDFFGEILCLNGDEWEGKPFILLMWECFIVGSLFGWKRKIDGCRRFRLAYIETAKGSGKTPLAAGLGIKGLCAEKIKRAEIYACATLKDQAMVLFRDAVAFYEQSPELQRRLSTSGGKGKEWRLDHPDSGSFFQIVSSDKKKSGPRPYRYIADEVHEHVDGTIIGLLEKGFKRQKEPLGIEITNAGHDVTSFCWERHEMGRKIACELETNDSIFAYICSLDEEDLVDDAYLYDESVWIKANPSLDEAGIPGYDYIKKQIENSKSMASQRALVKRLNFCIWTEAENPWISSEMWNPCRDDNFNEELLEDRRCWGGLDLSGTRDLTAFTLVFEPIEGDPFYRLKPFFWIPGENIIQKSDLDHVPYDVWRDKKFLFTSPGFAISKTQVIKFIYDASQKYDFQGVAYDRDRIKELFEFAEKENIDISLGEWDKDNRKWNFRNSYGIKMMPFGQKHISMEPAISKFETLLLNKEIKHDGNPVQTWCIANAVITADDDNKRKLSKRKSVGRIDGAITIVMAVGILEDKNQKSVYNERGLLVL